MVKVTAPLFSQSASGNLKKQIIYTTVNGVPVVKKYNKATDTFTTEQQIERSIFLTCANSWKLLTPEEQQPYKERAKGKPLTGYNIYMSECIAEERKTLLRGRYGTARYGVNTYGPD